MDKKLREAEHARLLEQERLRQAQERIKAEEARQHAIFSADKHKGFCPQCGSKNIREYKANVGVAIMA